MRAGYYPKLAWDSMRKNKQLYIPYLLTCIGMVMMFYIVAFLSGNEAVAQMSGGDIIVSTLGLGRGVIGVFALIFLFYTNSFLIRRRKKEFGLYNILGMGKRNLAVILIWESLFIIIISLSCGLIFGILFSKLAELGIVNLLQGTVSYSLSLRPEAITDSAKLFLIIFALILLNTLRQLRIANPIELLRSENTGEKPPRANWLFALAGAAILAAAYYIAVTIDNPLVAMMLFFVAVIMVIVATYLLFISGSVTFCRALQKNKRYYYKKNHFVSVSSMVYRMKRNGAGLASVCILCTMVLVMLSSTVCLYFGKEESLHLRYPRDINLDFTIIADYPQEEKQKVREMTETIVADHGLEQENMLDYQIAGFAGTLTNNQIRSDDPILTSSSTVDLYSYLWQVFFVPLEDYNRLMGEQETLDEGEVLVYTTKTGYQGEEIRVGDGEPMKIKKIVSSFVAYGLDGMQMIPSIYLFVPDFESYLDEIAKLKDEHGESLIGYLAWVYSFDLNAGDEKQIEVFDDVEAAVSAYLREIRDNGGSIHAQCEGLAAERQYFYALYGGIFFLGILLGIVFVFATVLMIYYKQISEGYEDQARFAIMQKVGMTDKEIRKSINSQVLTVFFLPLLGAGVHLAFAFPLINRILLLFNLTNTIFLITVTVCCYLIFALFYVLVYRITSRAYYTIVSGAKEV